ncbi:MAG TPA: peroxiredoxin [Candidatus Paenalcaligenes intestinipullorum]|uniref:thioredoxin-dependent peroxiredoxin n=1 Tax=Candidatus Paenalcaligenes intestinipullorum TaxID=2838718 RepID=A0A9D2U8R9_9BURK|nr:peroxiredoxin [Candidatus Paenalcaligenes intestinipullorum]
MTSLVEGQPIPDFTAQSDQGELSSQALRGTPFVLYFYPRDNTPGCTTQAQGFRDLKTEFDALGVQVIGVSRDSLASHERFRDKQSLNFPLISDPDEALCSLFDVMKLKNMYGKQVRGIERSTFLIDQNGVLRQAWRKVRVPGHVDAVLEAARQL